MKTGWDVKTSEEIMQDISNVAEKLRNNSTLPQPVFMGYGNYKDGYHERIEMGGYSKFYIKNGKKHGEEKWYTLFGEYLFSKWFNNGKNITEHLK